MAALRFEWPDLSRFLQALPASPFNITRSQENGSGFASRMPAPMSVARLSWHGRAHRDELLRSGRVDGNGAVEIGLSRAHGDGDTHELDHFTRAVAHDVGPDDLICRFFDDDLHQDALVPPRERRLHGAESGFIDIDLA